MLHIPSTVLDVSFSKLLLIGKVIALYARDNPYVRFAAISIGFGIRLLCSSVSRQQSL